MLFNKTQAFEKCIRERLYTLGYDRIKWNNSELYTLSHKEYNEEDIKETLFFLYSHGNQGCLEVNPSVGICFEAIERVKYRLLRLDVKKKYIPIPTIGKNLFCIIPSGDYGRWSFSEPHQIQTICDGIINEINTFGHYWYNKYGTLENLKEGLENVDNKDFDLYDKKINLPVIYLVEGNKQKGIDYINMLSTLNSKAYVEPYEQRFVQNYYAI